MPQEKPEEKPEEKLVEEAQEEKQEEEKPEEEKQEEEAPEEKPEEKKLTAGAEEALSKLERDVEEFAKSGSTFETGPEESDWDAELLELEKGLDTTEQKTNKDDEWFALEMAMENL